MRLLLQTRDELFFAVARADGSADGGGDGSGGGSGGARAGAAGAASTAAAAGALRSPCPHAQALLVAAREALRDCGQVRGTVRVRVS